MSILYVTSIRKCPSYDYDQKEIRSALEKSIADLGGLAKYVSPNETVLLKINLLASKRPEEAVTTHPAFTMALAEILMDFGLNVIIGDSPAGPYNERALKRIYEGSSYNQYTENSKAILNTNFETLDVDFPDGKLLKKLKIIDIIDKVDHVFSISKLKTHGMMTFTGATKNMFGAIPGTLKAEYHLRMPDYNDFADMLLDINEYIKPTLCFMDGIIGMEGNGPAAGDPIEVGAVLASDNPYALDYHATHLIQLDYKDVPTLTQAFNRNLITLDSIASLKGDWDQKQPIIFRVPKHKSFSKFDSKWFKFASYPISPRPVVNKDICVKCGECAASCPPQVIEMNTRNGFPKIDYFNCIKCYCCQELCPIKAMDIHKPLLNKIIFKS